jgi:hypothetical protein
MNAILFRDLLMNMLLGLVALVVLVLANINPTASEDPISQPGNLIASAAWPAGSTDVDIWVIGPDNEAVGYSHKSGKLWSLLRDDLGTSNDDTPLNYESAFTRGLPDGEYAVNVRCYACQRGAVPVSVEIRLAEGGLIWRGVVDLLKDKQERTAQRFRIADGRVVPGSANSVFKDMRRGASS